MKKQRIGIVGLGNMGRAIARGLKGNMLCGFDVSPGSSRRAVKLGVKILKSCSGVADHSDIIIFAVKPQEMENVLGEIRSSLCRRHLLISIAAGVSTRFIETIAKKARVIRVMPNIAIQAGEGVSAVCSGMHATGRDEKAALGIFGSMGKSLKVPEKHMDAVTAVSGSGPAYFFEIIECISAAGSKLGLDAGSCMQFVIQTAKGAVRMLETTGLGPSELRDMVTSKKGTTIEALNIFNKYKLKSIIFKAVSAARKRASQLSRV